MPRRETRMERLVYRWCGIAVLAGTLVGAFRMWQVSGNQGLAELGSLAATSLLVLGKFIVFVGLHEDRPSPWALAVMVWLMDLLIAFALASGLGALERAPMMGRWLRRARTRALEVLKEYPGLERMAFFGVVFFVMLPLAATGAVSGSFAARLMGLSRIAGVVAIAFGAAGTAFSFALLAYLLGERAEELARSPFLVGLSLLLLVLLGRQAYVRITKKLKEG